MAWFWIIGAGLPLMGYIYWTFIKPQYCKSKARLTGCTAVVTGSNSGIGKETALDLAKRGAKVILACRNVQKAEDAAKEIENILAMKNRVKVMKLDLSSLKSVREFAKQFRKEESRLDILVNNAGVLNIVERTLTEDGLELTMAANHFGHFLLTNLLMGMLKSSVPSRVVNVSSLGHFGARKGLPFEDLTQKDSYSPTTAYFYSKLANVLFTRELAKRLKGTGVTTYALHPGGVNTEIFRTTWYLKIPVLKEVFKLMLLTPCQGAQTQIYCSVAEELQNETGKYYNKCREVKPSPAAQDDEAACQLWDISEKLTGLTS